MNNEKMNWEKVEKKEEEEGKLNKYGFIIIRHVNSEETNKYWNECVRCIHRLHVGIKIVVIDDNSILQFIKNDFPYENVEYVQSEFPQRGELLPYYYFYKNHYFENAVILHDSVFIQKKINFEGLNVNVLPLWHFSVYKNENLQNSLRMARYLNNNDIVVKKLMESSFDISFNKKWMGCFGVQSFINYDFLCNLQKKYNLFRLLECINNRLDRCCLERIMGILFFLEDSCISQIPSLFGDILKYSPKLTYKEHRKHMREYSYNRLPYIKVWTGR